MRRVLRQYTPILLLACGLVSVPAVAAAQVLGSVAGDGQGRISGGAPRRHRGSIQPGAHRKDPTAVTDGAGQYRIVNLPPGTYVMTFTLSDSVPSGVRV
jgi:hypothetical protein